MEILGPGGKKLVGMRMIFESKLINGVFDRYKARAVVQGHPGAIRKGIDYDTVFAAAPHLESGRILQAMGTMYGWKEFTYDVKQAYLLGKAEKDQQYPVRYPEGPIRDAHRCPKTGEERYALVTGNIYGIPTAGRVYAKERDRLMTVVLPKKTGWKCKALLYEPCIYEILTENGRVLINTHTDDCDGYAEHHPDADAVIKVCNKLFSCKGADGIKVVSPTNMLGITRSKTTKKGVRSIKLTQTGYIESVWDTYKKEIVEKRLRPAAYAYPKGDKHPVLNNEGMVTNVPGEEVARVHKRGYRQITGSLLWAARNTMPECLYASSMMSKCMASPSEVAWDAALHVLHYMFTNKEEGLTFSSNGNLEPVLYYDSGFNQKHLYDKPQYSFVIFWCGAPILWDSKRHPQIPQSVSQAEYQTLTHAWTSVKWVRELFKDLGLGQWVSKPTYCFGDNRNAKDWANDVMMTKGCRHFDRRYFTIMRDSI